jgi:hypothetical protein
MGTLPTPGHAESEAASKTAQALERGDLEGQSVWRRIRPAIAK